MVKSNLIMNEEKIRQIIFEELSRQDIKAMIDGKLDSYIKEKEVEKHIRKIAVDVLDGFFREMWRKNGFWKNSLKNG